MQSVTVDNIPKFWYFIITVMNAEEIVIIFIRTFYGRMKTGDALDSFKKIPLENGLESSEMWCW